MSACEKCWADAGHEAFWSNGDKAAIYRRLMDERRDNPCTPEEQAGPDAGFCVPCNRRTLHQHTGECMAMIRCVATDAEDRDG